MIDLRQHREPVVRFVEAGLDEFRRSHRDEPIGHVALYCCPWRGWVSLCLAPAQQSDQNCPDFKHFGVAMYEAAQWAEAYEHTAALEVVDLAGQTAVVNDATEGDEGLNRVFFEFLAAVLHEPRVESAVRRAAQGSVRIGVQCLDSQFNDAWSLNGRADR